MYLWAGRVVYGRMPLPVDGDRKWPDLLSESEVVRLWKRTGLRDGPIAAYRRNLGIFFAYCAECSLDPRSQLTARGVERFCRWYLFRGRPAINRSFLHGNLRSPLSAYAWALSVSGHEVPIWKTPINKPVPPAIVAKYIAYAGEHRGLARSGLVNDEAILTDFVGYLKRRKRHWRQVSILEIDGYLVGLARKWAPATVGRAAYSVRSWLRFLHATSRLRHDLSPGVMAPVRRRYDQPPRARPWPEIKKMVQAIDERTPIGLRDRAQFLLMGAYGLGSSEVIKLRFDDIDWRSRCLRVVRRKTKVPISLPLLPAVARALTDYIRKGRPRFGQSRYVFLSARRPFRPFDATGVLRHRVRNLARRVGIKAAVLGAHIFRHSHATRQLEIGTPMKTLGDILGHQDPEATSIYTRAAVQHLRRLALPVPS
jgi:integrase/recombinase XerD